MKTSIAIPFFFPFHFFNKHSTTITSDYVSSCQKYVLAAQINSTMYFLFGIAIRIYVFVMVMIIMMRTLNDPWQMYLTGLKIMFAKFYTHSVRL